MPRRQVANTTGWSLGSLTTGSTDGTAVFLGAPYNNFMITGTFSSGTSGTVQLQGGTSSGTTGTQWLLLATIDNTTQSGVNGTLSPSLWIRARATAISTGGNPSTITVAASAAF